MVGKKTWKVETKRREIEETYSQKLIVYFSFGRINLYNKYMIMVNSWWRIPREGENEEFKFQNRYINFYQFEIFAIKAGEKQKNNKKICHIFHHNFKNIPCYVMSEVSLKRFYSIWWWAYFKNFEIGVYRFLNSNSSNILTISHWNNILANK